MEWYKHDTSASNDARIKKLILRHGAIGYAIYFHCLELIAGDVNVNNLTFQLEHDSEIIADNLKICGTSEKSGQAIVEDVMKYIISLQLFEIDNNRIYCMKLLNRLDTSMTSNAKFRSMITAAKSKNVMMLSCHGHDAVMQEEKEEKEEKEEREQPKEDTLPKKVKHPGTGLAMSATRYSALCDKHGSATVDDYMERIQLYCESKPRKPYADAAATAATWIRKDIDKGTFRGIQSYDYDEDIKKKTAYFGAKD